MPDEPEPKQGKQMRKKGVDLRVEPIEDEGVKVIIEEVDEGEPDPVPRERLAMRRPELKIKAKVIYRGPRKQGPPTNPADAYARLNKKP